MSYNVLGTFVSVFFSVQIIHTDSNTVLGQNDTGFSCDGSANTFRVMFKEPVEILPNVNYTACATLKVCDVSLILPSTLEAVCFLGVHFILEKARDYLPSLFGLLNIQS